MCLPISPCLHTYLCTFASRVSAACRGTSDSHTAFRRLAGARPALVEQLLRRGMSAVVSSASPYRAQGLCSVPEWHRDFRSVHCIHCTALSVTGRALVLPSESQQRLPCVFDSNLHIRPCQQQTTLQFCVMLCCCRPGAVRCGRGVAAAGGAAAGGAPNSRRVRRNPLRLPPGVL